MEAHLREHGRLIGRTAALTERQNADQLVVAEQTTAQIALAYRHRRGGQIAGTDHALEDAILVHKARIAGIAMENGQWQDLLQGVPSGSIRWGYAPAGELAGRADGLHALRKDGRIDGVVWQRNLWCDLVNASWQTDDELDVLPIYVFE